MKERLKMLYATGALSEKGLGNAVKRGYITREESEEIKESKPVQKKKRVSKKLETE